MQRRRQCVAPHHQGQRQQHLGLVVVDGFHKPEGHIAQNRSQNQSPADFLPEQQGYLGWRNLGGPQDGNLQNGEKNNHAHAVVEQRLTGNDDFKVFRNLGFFQNSQHRDGVGRRNECSQ